MRRLFSYSLAVFTVHFFACRDGYDIISSVWRVFTVKINGKLIEIEYQQQHKSTNEWIIASVTAIQIDGCLIETNGALPKQLFVESSGIRSYTSSRATTLEQ